jgi:ribosomal protection tetracycline resistance protein
VLRTTLNLGILAHVDAGKTTLTERLLFDAGVIHTRGSVDRGTTQTDTLALERQRGITIRAAVASFPLGDVDVNLIDTPGHPDFIAEVERSLAVLDGVVLVVSAVEGVQAQTLVLFRALQRLQLPTIVFVNKTDRTGADVDRVLAQVRARLSPDAVAAWAVDLAQLAEHDDELLAAYVAGREPSSAILRAALASLTRRASIQPVLHGSAITGAGLDELRGAIVDLLPATAEDADGPVAATVFKIEPAGAGEKVAYVRMFAGTLHVRDRVSLAPGVEEKVTALEVFDRGSSVRAQSVTSGRIARVRGLRRARIGDRIGALDGGLPRQQFAPPALEAVVRPLDPADAARLRLAVDQLAEQDPLIGARHGEELAVSLYGEVQKEVLEATLADDYGLAVRFEETTPIYVERPTGVGEAVELLNAESNPYHAQVGLRVEPAPPDAGVEFRLAVTHERVPLYAYKRLADFELAMGEYVRDALASGPHGWEVVDCVVTMTDSWYSSADGPPSRRGPLSTPADFRGLTPIVLAQALERAGTVVCEPIMHLRLELPVDALGATMAAASRLGAELEMPEPDGESAVLGGILAAVRVSSLQRLLPALTRGEGVLETAFAGYRPAVSAVPGCPSSEAR